MGTRSKPGQLSGVAGGAVELHGQQWQEEEHKEEQWQDEDFPRALPVDQSPAANQSRALPSSLDQSGMAGGGAKKRLVAPTLSLTLSRSDWPDPCRDVSTDTLSLDINLEAMDTPSQSETGSETGCHELEWEDDLPHGVGGVRPGGASPEEACSLRLDEVDSRGRRWRRFCISGEQLHVNMSVLEPYLQVLSHGGYHGDGLTAVILFSCCFLPDTSVDDYEYVMEHLFRYVVGTLDLMVSNNYVLVCLCGAVPRTRLPAVRWLHQCYCSIHRRLKKDLKHLLVVHPAWYIKALITLVKPFISEKFSRKVSFVHSLEELSALVSTEQLLIPPSVRELDEKMKR